MNQFRRIFFLFSFIIVALSAFAEEAKDATIKGVVKLSDGKPAAYVSILLKGTGKATITGEDGKFTFRNLAAGTYEVLISLVGYETITKTVTTTHNATALVDVQLDISAQQLDEVTVQTNKNSYKSNTISPSLRLNEPLLEAAQNIQIVSGKLMGDQQIISMSDGVVRNVSGTNRNDHWGDLYANISSRGSQIQAFRNGFNVVNSYWGPLTEDMSFVDHIEFVKGPAGFMLANGDPSGLYNVVTKKPTGVTKGEVEMTTGSYGLYRGTVDLDGKLNKAGTLLYRLNFMGQDKGSFRANEFNNRYSIAPVVSYQVDDKTKITLEYTLQHAKMSDVGSYYVFAADGYATLPRKTSFLPAGLEPTVIDDNSVYLNMQHQINDHWKLTAQGAYFNYMQIGSSMWPDAVNADGTVQRAVSSWDAKSTMTLLQAFVNGEVNTGTIHHRILGGVDMGNKNYYADWNQYFTLDTVAISASGNLTGVPSAGYPAFDHNKKTIEQRGQAIGGTQDLSYTSLYVQDELGFFDNTARLTLAGRYTDVKQSSFGGAPETAKRFTPRVSLSVSVNKSTSVYAVYDQAFLPQSGTRSNGKSTQPITGNNMEIGIKKDWAGGNWSTTIAAYRILKNNELTTDPNADPNSGLSVELGQKRSQGIEFDLRGKITNGLNLVANYALTDSKITKVTDGVTDYKKGDDVPGYAKHIANVWLTYKVQSGALQGLGVSAGSSLMAGRHSNDENAPDPTQKLPDYVKFDGGLFWEGTKIRITANMFNIFDKYTYSGSYYSYTSTYYWQADAPRNIRLSIGYKF